MHAVLYDEKKDSLFNKLYPFHDCEIVANESIFQYSSQFDISIIIPCYNVARFLPACIESLTSQQTRYSYEVIFVNDGSQDGTKEILEDAAHRYPSFRCIHQSNQGAGAARTEGMRNAKGRYLMFVDADDIVSSNYIEALTDCVEACDADMGVCAYYSFTENGTRYKEVKWPQGIKVSNVNGTPWGKIFRRELFDRLIWPSGYSYQDTILAFLVFPRVKKLAVTNQCAYGYRSSMQNTTNTTRKSGKALSTLYMTALVLRYMEKFDLTDWLNSLEGNNLLVNQFYLNQCRIQRLPREYQKELFRLQSQYYRGMDGHPAEKHCYDSKLYAYALRKNNAPIGMWAVKFEKANKAWRLLRTRIAAMMNRDKNV